MPPDPKAFESYYKDRLETFFKQETRLFFTDLLQQNGSILNLLDSDYSFLNGTLAQHYGVEGLTGKNSGKSDSNQNTITVACWDGEAFSP